MLYCGCASNPPYWRNYPVKRPIDFTISFQFVTAALLVAWVMPPALAQNQPYLDGIVDDWTHHHVIFSNPGTEEEAIEKGKLGEWLNIVSDPRYRMQQTRRYSPFAESTFIDATAPIAGGPVTARSMAAQPAGESSSLPE